ncbi:LCP family protein required for cell wall assembly [Marmoricola sp. OAE513]|uniref:LCP family protein n=1 Tax=Marmoricola sp. OAE513 TaxID=2817894 RepID=UPI001AE982A6
MPDDPQEPPEYDWLYGKKGRPVQREEPEQTRVIPTSPPARGKSSTPPPPPRRPAPTPSPTPAPEPGSSPGGRRRWPVWRIIRWGVPLLILAWLAFLVAVPMTAIKKIDDVDAFPASGRPAEQDGTTYLIVGSDSRAGLTKEELKKYGAGGVGDIGQRTDTIMLLHLGGGKPLLLSIPRDSLVPVPGHGTTKINAAFAFGGPKLLVKTIEKNTGLHVDHYVEIGFGGLVKAVDAVDGVEICPKKRMKDKKANLNIKKGCQTVDGVTALAYSRSRYVQRYGDITRAQHQREVVTALGKKVATPMTVINPWRYSRVVNAGTSTLKVSDGTGVIALGKFARAMTQVNGKDGLTCGMPIRDQAIHWDRGRALKLLQLIKEDRTDDVGPTLCTPTGFTK